VPAGTEGLGVFQRFTGARSLVPYKLE